ncbi:TPR repeat protein [Sphingomonas sp. SORGH_AS802]|jgi:TPR repeat protein|uniref:SEL1-like repeat protein n=1 Tax=unclassified Sphingomonas TaxID=196159 RepID=UPI0028548851|nr:MULTISPECIES: SEL1-like repeat protein [unclassified Sphingomonas]MDR6128502.1 TPR repeat protein [Sphingomonas sp. SORGH_AS_0438]MDR6135297.1 TPR repeat protein [Sphingomonas sp. SORGH_AS_0802]
MGNSFKSAQFLIESRIADAAAGDVDALFDLGICYQTGTAGLPIDLIEAHKWFNLAAVRGSQAAHDARAEVAEELTAREIATAQAAARAWLRLTTSIRHAA